MMDRLLVLVGMATVGAFFGALTPQASADSEVTLTVQEMAITSAVPTDACVDFRINEDDSADCLDGDIAGTYDVDHYAVEADTDGEGFYLLVWK